MMATRSRLAQVAWVGLLVWGTCGTAWATSPIEDILQEAAQTPPQQSIGLVIEDICPAGVLDPGGDLQARCDELVDGVLGVVSGSLAGTDLPGALEGLQAMAPEEGAVLATQQLDASGGDPQAVHDRLSSLRSGAGAGLVQAGPRGFQISGLAAGEAGLPRWGFFLNGFYANSDRDTTLRESGFKADDVGVTAGIDYLASDRVTLGLAGVYKDSDADIKADGGSLDTESYSVFVYGSYVPADNWYLDTVFGYTANDHEQERTVAYTITAASGASGGVVQTITVDQSALSSNDSDELSVSVTAGYEFVRGAWMLSPYARFDYADVSIDGFTERMSAPAAPGSGLALVIDEQDFESMTATLGALFTSAIETGWGSLHPELQAEYVHEFENDGEPVTGHFVDDPTATRFAMLLDPPDRNYVTAGAGVSAVFSPTVLGFVRYQGLFGYEDLSLHAVEVGVRVGF